MTIQFRAGKKLVTVAKFNGSYRQVTISKDSLKVRKFDTKKEAMANAVVFGGY